MITVACLVSPCSKYRQWHLSNTIWLIRRLNYSELETAMRNNQASVRINHGTRTRVKLRYEWAIWLLIHYSYSNFKSRERIYSYVADRNPAHHWANDFNLFCFGTFIMWRSERNGINIDPSSCQLHPCGKKKNIAVEYPSNRAIVRLED